MPPAVQHLLSLPPAMASNFHRLFPESSYRWFVSSDPAGQKLGSGGGAAHLLAEAAAHDGMGFHSWLGKSKKLAILAGGQSRRLPAYGATGKVLMPVPVMRWAHGQRLDQTLLDMQSDDYTRILDHSPETARVLIASGDVFLKIPDTLPAIPSADVVGFGMAVSPEIAADFGVFFSPRDSSGEISFFIQKPTADKVRELAPTHAFFVDTGLWLLSQRATEALMGRCGWTGDASPNGQVSPYELYSEFGPAIGATPFLPDPMISGLGARVIVLENAGFFHFGTTRQIIESLSALQNCGSGRSGQSTLWRKPHPDMYVLNSDFAFSRRSPENKMLWIENCSLPADFLPAHENALTGLPAGNWTFVLRPGQCLDCVPVGEENYVVRAYGFDDVFSGSLREALWMGEPAMDWFEKRGISLAQAGLDSETDIQEARLFAAVSAPDSDWITWLLHGSDEEDAREKWLAAPRFSAKELGEEVHLGRLFRQRKEFSAKAVWQFWEHRSENPFYRIDLENAAQLYAQASHPVPEPDPSRENAIESMHDHAFTSAVLRARGEDGADSEKKAFAILADRIVTSCGKVEPHNSLIEDQILWARAPIRLDLAGGWSDTPPFCLKHGGAVVNLGANLNGQAPVQVFVRICQEPHLVIRSIDLGAQQVIRSFEELEAHANLSGEFSLAKAAFCIAGFHPRFHKNPPSSLANLLKNFGGGIEVTLLAATPKGSGLGTSSVLAATLLAALGATGGLAWDQEDLFRKTLAVEQMLTSGGGWQDQAGGIYHGIKLVETAPGLDQKPLVRWLPEHLFASQTANRMALLYYTGITRVARTILQEIVRGMLLNNSSHMEKLFAIRDHALAAYQAIQRESWSSLCRVVNESRLLNESLDKGTSPPEIAAIIRSISDWTDGVKLLGAGGGGYMLILSKDEESGNRVRQQLTLYPPNLRARFVDFSVSQTGLQITRS